MDILLSPLIICTGKKRGNPDAENQASRAYTTYTNVFLIAR